jgi:hypothetical protein
LMAPILALGSQHLSKKAVSYNRGCGGRRISPDVLASL